MMVAGCDRKIAVTPTPLPATPARRPEPVPSQPTSPPATPHVLVGASFGRVVTLEGVTLEHDTIRAGDYLRIWLHWRSIAPSSEDLRSIGRLITGNGRVLASEDDQIGGRRRHLSKWQVGDRSIDEMRLRLTANTAPGEYGLVVGVLRSDNQTAVPLTGRSPAGSDWQEDAVLIGTIEVVAG
jgi:hypothetical protein